MSKNIGWIISLFVVIFIGDRGLGFILKKRAKNAPFRYSRLYYADSLDYQIIIVGSSRGQTFHAPEVEQIVKKSTFNLSYDGLPSDIACCLAMDYLDRHKPPKVLIVEISNCNNDGMYLKSRFKPFIGESFRLDSLIRAVHLSEDSLAGFKIATAAHISWLFRYNSNFVTRFLKYSPDPNYIEWAESANMDSTMFQRIHSDYWGAAPKIEQVNAIKQLVNLAKAKKVKVRLLIAPFFPMAADSIQNTFLKPLIEQVEKETGLFVDNCSKMATKMDLFANPSHLNRVGAIKMIDTLNQLHFFD